MNVAVCCCFELGWTKKTFDDPSCISTLNSSKIVTYLKHKHLYCVVINLN